MTRTTMAITKREFKAYFRPYRPGRDDFDWGQPLSNPPNARYHIAVVQLIKSIHSCPVQN